MKTKKKIAIAVKIATATRFVETKNYNLFHGIAASIITNASE